MKLIDIYNHYKEKNKDSVIIIKSGIFYTIFNNDIPIMYSLFHYKVKLSGKNYEMGFPLNNISSVTDKLKQNKINYIILEKENTDFVISDKFKTKNNNYCNYRIDVNKMYYRIVRITNIYNKLYSMILDDKIDDKMTKLEEIL